MVPILISDRDPSDSSHQRLKLTGRATPATLLASPLLHRRRVPKMAKMR
jgi:hypothetical protein